MTDDPHTYPPDAGDHLLPARGELVHGAERVEIEIVDDLPAAAVTAAADALRTTRGTDDEIAQAVLSAGIKALAP